MPQTHKNTENRNNRGITDKPRFKNTNKRKNGKYFYPTRYQYYNTMFGYQPPWNYFQWRQPPYRARSRKTEEKEPPRPSSPFTGTEEYNLKKIQEASDMIKKQLLMAPDTLTENCNNFEKNKAAVATNKNSGACEKKNEKCESEKTGKNSDKTVNNSKKPMQYNVEEIHKKIITHITNLNHGKKMNLICATSSGYDEAIQRIQRQKRLELSKALRDMCSNQTVENSEVFNSIMPDIGIKIEDLPLEVIQELSSTLDLNYEESLLLNDSDDIVQIKTEVCESEEYSPDSPGSRNVEEEKEETFVCDVTDNVVECPMDMDIKMEPTDAYLLPMHDSTGYENFQVDNVTNCSTVNVQNSNFPESEIPPKIDIDSGTNCVSTQTDSVSTNSNATQTDLNFTSQLQLNNEAENLEDAIKSMLDIDKEIARLTELRQSIFLQLQSKKAEQAELKNKTVTESLKNKKQMDKIKKHRKKKSSEKEKQTTKKAKLNNSTLNDLKETDRTVETTLYTDKLNFENKSEKILVMKVFNGALVAGSESGKVFHIDLKTGHTLHKFLLGGKAVTAFCFGHTLGNNPHLFISSLDSKIREFNFRFKNQIRLIHTEEAVQCMELKWGFIFIGTITGQLMRYSLKSMKVEFKEKISQDRILVLQATQEGARRVLLVGTKNYPVCVRDAMSGLHMRTMNDVVAPTVYSLLLEDNLVYCGTTLHDILVYNFHDGTLVRKYQASNSKGVSCMKIVANLLFASCYDGNIYVYNTKTRHYVGLIEGPGGVILSMEVSGNLVIVGTMPPNFSSILIPEYILECKRSAVQLL